MAFLQIFCIVFTEWFEMITHTQNPMETQVFVCIYIAYYDKTWCLEQIGCATSLLLQFRWKLGGIYSSVSSSSVVRYSSYSTKRKHNFTVFHQSTRKSHYSHQSYSKIGFLPMNWWWLVKTTVQHSKIDVKIIFLIISIYLMRRNGRVKKVRNFASFPFAKDDEANLFDCWGLPEPCAELLWVINAYSASDTQKYGENLRNFLFSRLAVWTPPLFVIRYSNIVIR